MPEEESNYDHHEEFPSSDPFEPTEHPESTDHPDPETDFEAVNLYDEPTEGENAPPSAGFANRPAEGARHATPGEVLSEEFLGSDSAGDFLGLDVELSNELNLETEAEADLDLAAAPSVSTEVEEEGFSEDGEQLLDYPGTEEGYEDGEYPGEEELADGDLEELEAMDAPPSPRRRLALLAAGAFAVGLAAVSAVVFGPSFLEGDPVDPVRVGGGGPRTTPTPPPAPIEIAVEPTDSIVDPVAEDPSPLVDPVDPITDPVVSEDPIVDPVEPVVDPVAVTTPPELPPLDLESMGLRADTESVVATGPNTTPIELPEGVTLDASLLGGLSWAGPEKLEMIWRGDSAPMEAIYAPVKVITPRVGAVRVIMSSGRAFEGNLAALGQERVWLDTDLGRMGLEGDRVESIACLASEPAGAGEEVILARGDEVRVRTPGGLMYGRVVTRDGDKVILQTSSGARVTLTNPEIEPIGSTRVIVVDR